MTAARLGVALIEAYDGTPEVILAAYDRWAERVGAYPGLAAVWVHDGQPLDGLTRRGLQDHGAEVMVYLESGEHARDGYRGLLSGRLDHILATLDDPRLIVRLDHEMLPGWEAPWAGHPPERYIDAWVYARARVGGRMLWCPQGHTDRHRDLWARYLPPLDTVDIVGWDRYVRRKHPATPLPRVWAENLALMSALAPGKPVMVGEFGIEVGHPADRAAWLATLGDVEGVDAAMYFDVRMSTVDWRTDAPMRRTAGRLLGATIAP
jgi:hypothetical protein